MLEQTYGIRLSHIFEIPNISNKNFNQNTKVFDQNTRYFELEILKYYVFHALNLKY